MKINKSLILTFLVLVFASLACQLSPVPSTVQTELPSVIYTDLGSPLGLNVVISRMQDGNQTCYMVAGGYSGVSISCPTTVAQTGHPLAVVYTDLGSPDFLNAAISRMQDGNQTCYLIGGGYSGVSISCSTTVTQVVDPQEVIFTELPNPSNLNIAVAEMKDGDKTCYITASSKLVSISCP